MPLHVAAVLLVVTALVGFWIGRATVRGAALRAATRRLRETRDRLNALEDTAAAAEATFAAALDAVSEAILVLEPDLRVRAANAEAIDWFGFQPSDRPSLMAATRSAELQQLVREGMVEKEVDVPLGGSIRTGGRTLRVGVRRAHLGAVVALRDDTEMERLERARRDLVANISHDLRTPLTSIRLLVESLGGGSPLAGETDVTLEQLQGQVATLEAVTDSLIELNRVESGRALFRLQPVLVRDLAISAVDALQPQLLERRIDVDVDTTEELRVLADGPQVVRVLVNLLENAQRVTPPGGHVMVHAWAPDDALVAIEVRDSGPGIPPSEISRIFERFYRGDRARTGIGSGLGLAIARHIVEGHGGTIRAESPPGGGAILTFTLLNAGA
jgi:two-component system phosphate regulon sensor histidine kinase PhoR